MALTLLLMVPLLVGAWLVAGGRHISAQRATLTNLVASVVTLGLAVVVAVGRPTIDRAWLPSLGSRWHFTVDGISAPLILLTAAVGVLVAVHGIRHTPQGGSASTFHGCLLLVDGGALATFAAGDAILFFAAFEVVLVPMWVLITRFGDPHDAVKRATAGARFILYTATGSTLMLLGILLLVVRAGTADLNALPAAAAHLPHATLVLIAALLTAGLAVKVPLFPLHSWLPPAHTTAPTAGSVLLAAVLLKMGTYGLVRLPLASVPEGWDAVRPVVAVLGVIGILWGGLVCLVERDLKRLIAYSSVAHMGFVALGLASGTRTGLQAALFLNIAHGVISALLFFVVGGLKERWGRVDLTRVRTALREVAPRFGYVLVVGLAASLGLPGLAGFWGEFLTVYAAWSAPYQSGLFRWCAVLAAVGAALAAGYALRVARLLWVGDEPTEAVRAASTGIEADRSEQVVTLVLVCAILVLGVVPQVLLTVTDPAVRLVIGR
ncbi:MAG: NADH-quinone oxidoreductase subunit M [Nostocoides sp.]